MSALHTHSGWKYLRKLLLEQEKSLKSRFRTIEPDNATGIAKMQGKLEIIREIKDKPERYFKAKKNNGG